MNCYKFLYIAIKQAGKLPDPLHRVRTLSIKKQHLEHQIKQETTAPRATAQLIAIDKNL